MSTEAKQPTKLQLSAAMIEAAPNSRALLDIPAIEQNWVDNYNKLTGRSDGAQRFNAEKIMFLQAVNNSASLAKTDKFSQYSAFIELSISGLTLRDGLAYIVAFKGKAQYMPGWRGRLEQIKEVPEVVHTHEPQVVFDVDEFDYEMGAKIKINKHRRGKRRDDGTDIITHVYFVIDYTYGTVVYIMERPDVLHIRDAYSASFKSYQQAATAQGKKLGEPVKAMWQGQIKDYDMEIPMWVADEPQAFKKTIVKRVYGMQTKLPKRLKAQDERIKAVADEEVLDSARENDFTEILDIKDAHDGNTSNEGNPVNAGLTLGNGSNSNTGAGETGQPGNVGAASNVSGNGNPVAGSAGLDQAKASGAGNDLAGMVGNPNESF